MTLVQRSMGISMVLGGGTAAQTSTPLNSTPWYTLKAADGTSRITLLGELVISKRLHAILLTETLVLYIITPAGRNP